VWGRVASQARTIVACFVLAVGLMVYVFADPGMVHPAARVIFAYSAACGVLLIPLYLVSSRGACRMVARNQEVLRRKEQFGRPIDATDLSVGEMLGSIMQVQTARLVRLLLLGLLIYLSVRFGWSLELFPRHVLLALFWGVTAFVGLGGVAGRPLRSRGRSAALGVVVFGIGLIVPVAVVLYMAVTAALGGASFAAGLGVFQHPLMHSRAVTDPIMSGELRRSLGEYMRRTD
jgi:hypothetical protein